jgi:hypothetical protein
MDFADTLHIRAAEARWSLATFDARLVRAAKGKAVAQVRSP